MFLRGQALPEGMDESSVVASLSARPRSPQASSLIINIWLSVLPPLPSAFSFPFLLANI